MENNDYRTLLIAIGSTIEGFLDDHAGEYLVEDYAGNANTLLNCLRMHIKTTTKLTDNQ